MASVPSFSNKQTDETVVLTFDFKNVLATGETIQNATWSVTVYKGTDASPENILTGSPGISGNKVNHTVTAGVNGVTYEIKCQITTSANQVIDGIGKLLVKNV